MRAPKIFEADIKAAIIDCALLEQIETDHSVFVSEMPVPGWRRRADLVVANGSLIAFEIKSDADRLIRLQDQIRSYLRWFEDVEVVLAPKFMAWGLAHLPEAIGLSTFATVGGLVTVERLRPAQRSPLSAEAALRHLSVLDLRRVVRDHMQRRESSSHRQHLETVVRCLPPETLRQVAISAIKKRYHERALSRLQAKMWK